MFFKRRSVFRGNFPRHNPAFRVISIRGCTMAIFDDSYGRKPFKQKNLVIIELKNSSRVRRLKALNTSIIITIEL